MKLITKVAICIFCFFSNFSFSQNIAINRDGTSAETGVILDVKGIHAISTTTVQNVFQIKSFNASGAELKMRMALGTHATAGSRYGALEVYDAGATAYRSLSLQPSGGNVGIGTATPVSLCHVNGAARFGTASTTSGSLIFNQSASANAITIQPQAAALSAAYSLTLPPNDGNANEMLTTDGAGLLTWKSLSSLPGGCFSNVWAKTTAANYTFTVPSGVTQLFVEVWGAGGGGSNTSSGGANFGGGGGGYAAAFVTVTAGNNYTMTVGAGGTPGPTLATNTNGGDSFWNGTELVGGGGKKGLLQTIPGTGGGTPTSTVANAILIPGSIGGGYDYIDFFTLYPPTQAYGHGGAAGGKGGGGGGKYTETGSSPGGGGSAGGGFGAAGAIIIWW